MRVPSFPFALSFAARVDHWLGIMASAAVSKRALDICSDISQILNTGLDREELEMVIKLVQQGENPEVGRFHPARYVNLCQLRAFLPLTQSVCRSVLCHAQALILIPETSLNWCCVSPM